MEEVTSLLCRFDDEGRPDMRTCQTHQAFVGVLSTVIREFRDRLIVIEKETALQGERSKQENCRDVFLNN